MGTVFIILAIVFAVALILYLVFIVGPALMSFDKIFGKKSDKPLEGRDISKTYFAPYEKMMREAVDRVEKNNELKRVKTTAYDGLDLYADYIDQGSDKTVAFFHGYSASPLVNFGVHTEYFLKQGYNVLLVFQRAHGVSGGEYCALGVLEWRDVLSWVEYLDKMPCKNVVLYGISMGTTTIAYASEHIKSDKVKVLVLDCGYLSPYMQIFRDCERRHLPGRLLLPIINGMFRRRLGEDLRKNTVDSLKNNKIPSLFLHGKTDETVPYNDSQVNYDACAGEKKLLLPDGLHHTLSFFTGSDEMRAEIFDYIEAHFDKNATEGENK